jgi:hypothetical protein
MIPDLKLGIIVLTNQQNGPAFIAISNTIKDRYLGLSNPDHVAALSDERKQRESNADKITDDVWAIVEQNIKSKTLKITNKPYLGTYKDNWFGAISITDKKGKLYFSSERSSRLKGEIFFVKDQTFAVKWDVRSFHADAFIYFELDPNGKATHITMKPISPMTDFSYDFQDLDFNRVN